MDKQYVIKFLSQFYELSDLQETTWIKGEVETPKEKKKVFFNFFNDNLFLISVNDYVNNLYLDNVLHDVDDIITNKNINEYSIFSINVLGFFDNVLIIKPDNHDWFKSFDVEIHNITNWCIPINHCEYVSDRKYWNYFSTKIDLVNWNRSICPFMKARLNDPVKKIKATKKSFFCTIENVLNNLSDFKTENSWIELTNYKQKKILIEYIPILLNYKMTNDCGSFVFNLNDTIFFVNEFISK